MKTTPTKKRKIFLNFFTRTTSLWNAIHPLPGTLFNRFADFGVLAYQVYDALRRNKIITQCVMKVKCFGMLEIVLDEIKNLCHPFLDLLMLLHYTIH